MSNCGINNAQAILWHNWNTASVLTYSVSMLYYDTIDDLTKHMWICMMAVSRINMGKHIWLGSHATLVLDYKPIR